MVNDLDEPIFNGTPGSPQKWQVWVWSLAIVIGIVTEVIRYEKKKKEKTIQTKDVGLSDTQHKTI